MGFLCELGIVVIFITQTVAMTHNLIAELKPAAHDDSDDKC